MEIVRLCAREPMYECVCVCVCACACLSHSAPPPLGSTLERSGHPHLLLQLPRLVFGFPSFLPPLSLLSFSPSSFEGGRVLYKVTQTSLQL